MECLGQALRLLFICTLMVAGFISPGKLYADVGLVIVTPTGVLGFLSNVGHVSVWISHGCLDDSGHIRYCDVSDGLVLTSTAYWPNPGAAAIPAKLFFLGSQPGLAGRGVTAWNSSLASMYPAVEPAVGAKYLGRAFLRGLRVLRFETSPAEDRRVLAEIDASQNLYRYSYSERNCAFYAQAVLQRYFGPKFHANRILELGIDTPRSVERALRHELKSQSIEFRTVIFKGKLRHAWRQPPRDICESAILDPKYAVPLLMYEPYLYAGFVGCYATIRISTFVRTLKVASMPLVTAASADLQLKQPQLYAFQMLTTLTSDEGAPAALARSDGRGTEDSLGVEKSGKSACAGAR